MFSIVLSGSELSDGGGGHKGTHKMGCACLGRIWSSQLPRTLVWDRSGVLPTPLCVSTVAGTH